MKETPKASTDEQRKSTMTNAEVSRIDENDKAAPSDEALKNSSSRRPTTAAATTAEAARPQSDTTSRSTIRPTPNQNRAAGTSGTRARTATDTTAQSNSASRSSRSLPRTAGELPLFELLSGLAFVGGLGIRAFRR